MKVTIDVEIRDFNTPNYVVPVQPTGEKQDGLQGAPAIPLRDVPAELLDTLCKNFRREVFRKAERQDPEDRK